MLEKKKKKGSDVCVHIQEKTLHSTERIYTLHSTEGLQSRSKGEGAISYYKQEAPEQQPRLGARPS